MIAERIAQLIYKSKSLTKKLRSPRGSNAVALLALLVTGPSWSQQLTTDGRCPAGMVLPSMDLNTDYFTIVGSPDLYVGADDDRLMEPRVSESLPMQTAVIKVEETEFRVLLRTQRKVLDDDFICGWIAKQDALPKYVAPVNVGTPIDFIDPVTGAHKEIKNPLPLKALLRSNPEYESSDATRVSILEKPADGMESRTEASVFGIYLIYEQRLVDGELWYWIAGQEPWVPTRFAGWVADHHVLLWESQLSLYFNERVEQGTGIYFSRDAAASADSEGILAKRPEDFNERSIGLSNPDEEHDTNIARFPILLEQTSVADGSQSIYRIGFFGDSKYVEQVSQRGQVQQNIRKIDILFVLDNTLSMTEYFPYVVDAVRNATDAIADINESEGYDVEVKYAAAVYGDYLSNSAFISESQFQIVARLASPGYTEHLGRLSAIAEDVDYYRDEQGDKPEAGLAGIIRGVQELEWTDGTEFKVVVWIGDHGSRETGNAEQLTLNDVRTVLIDNSVVLLPINVSGRYDNIWNNEFVRQGNELASTRGLETKLAYTDPTSASYEDAAFLIEQAISNLYLSSLTASFAIREGTDVEQTLIQRRDLLELGIPAAEADVRKLSAAICEIAFGDQGCRNLSESGQFMGEGFVRYDSALQNYDFWVNLEYIQLDILKRVMQTACRGFERSNVRKSIEDAMLIVQTTMGGDVYRSDIPVGEYLRRYLFLPARHFPSILESTPDKIDEHWQAARDADTRSGNLEQTRAIADPLCRSAALLELAFDNKRLINPDTDLVRTTTLSDQRGGEYTWSVVSNDRLVDFNWEWSQGGENNYFYLPVTFLPSDVN